MRFQAVLLCAMTVCASSQCIEAAVWAETNGVCSALIGWRETVGAITNGVVRANDELLFVISSKSGPLDFSLPEDKAYTIRTRMFGADGKEVPKTYRGKDYGSKFDELRNNSEIRRGGLAVFGPHVEDPTLGRSLILFKPENVFNITKPGIYNLEVEMQMFRVNRSNPTNWTREVFRFPPVKIKVEKPPDDKRGKP